ncbi:glycosyltransferase family 4 protein [Nostocoides jenkinsii]|nr:glycosyltransferase family 4 protein [Tetrasphaera jenkinsii]
MRVCLVTQWFPPEPGTMVPSAIAQSLQDLGHTVDVLTGFPNYPTGRLPEGWRVRPYQRDVISDDLTIHRAPLYPSHDANAVRRMANYVSFAAGASLVANTRVPQPDAWLIYSSPATAALPAMLARRGFRAPRAMIVQDLWPDSVTGSGMVDGLSGKIIGGSLGAFCRASYRSCGAIGVISPGMADVLQARGVPADKIHYTPNSVDDSFLMGAEPVDWRAEISLPEGLVFLYAGNIGPLQDLVPLVRAFAGIERAHLVIVGDGVARDAVEDAAAGMPNVHLRPAVGSAEIGRLIMGADVQVVSLQDTPLMRVTMPSKVQTSLASGRPVLVHAAGDPAELVTAAGAGWSSPPGDVEATQHVLRRILSTSVEQRLAAGQRARMLFEANFTTTAALTHLHELLDYAGRGGK